MKIRALTIFAAGLSFLWLPHAAFAFEGRITAVTTQGSQTNTLLYTVGTNFLRVELAATNWPNPVDILDLSSGALTLLFPNNRSFVRLKPAANDPSTISSMPLMPPPPGVSPPAIGPQGQPVSTPGLPPMPNLPALPPGIGPQGGSAPGMPAMPAMPMMPIPQEKIELKPTGQTTNILGFTCQQYELKQRQETMQIWATDQLVPYQPYIRSQQRRLGPRRLEEQWPDLLASRKLFPLLAILRNDNGPERFRFEVTSIAPEKLTDADAKLFQPPSGYFEIQPLPF